MNIGLHPTRPVTLHYYGLFHALPCVFQYSYFGQMRIHAFCETSSRPCGHKDYWVSILFFFVLLIIGLDPAQGWLRVSYSDPEVVHRAEMIVIAHVKEGSIVYVPHPIRDGAMSWEHHATLIITEVIKGAPHGRELPIIVNYGLDPMVLNGEDDSSPHRFSEDGVEKYLGPTSTINIDEFGGRGGRVSGDIRKEQIWFLRAQGEKDEKFQDDHAGALGIWDPEDIQTLDLKPYFLAFLTDHPEEKLKEYSVGQSPLAFRSQTYLDHLRIEEILKEPNLTKRADLLLPLFLFTDDQKIGATQSEAGLQIWHSCGQVGAARLVSVFKDPKYEAMQNQIMDVWANAQYHDAVPILIDLLKRENRYWTKQTLAQRNLWVNIQPNHSPTMPQIRSRNRISMALFVFRSLEDPRSISILKETRELWERLYPHDPVNNFTRKCNDALLSIENAEEDRKRAER